MIMIEDVSELGSPEHLFWTPVKSIGKPTKNVRTAKVQTRPAHKLKCHPPTDQLVMIYMQ